MSWMVKFLGSCAAILVAFHVMGGGRDQPIVTTTDALNHVSIGRFVDDPSPSVVIVGSSLSFRLSESYFRSLHIDNLALVGGSPITGLKIVASHPKSPKLVLIEANLIERPVNDAIISSSLNRSA